MSTVYINPVDHTDARDRRVKAEIQVEPTEDAGGKLLDVRVHDHEEGDILSTVELNRDKAVELRDALEAWIATQPA